MPRRKPTTIMAAIDLGTTYSSISWAEVCEGTNHISLGNWPKSVPEFDKMTDAAKVPTEIVPDKGDAPIWGYQIPVTMPRLQWFKLALDPVGRKFLAEELDLPRRDPRRLRVPEYATDKSPTVEFLKALHDHFLQEVRRKRGINWDQMKKLNFQYIITVPGIWTMLSAIRTAHCAKKAGIGDAKSIKVLSEPEAAAFLTVKCYGHEAELQVGNTVVVCDAGGGTVDLVTVTIQERSPLRLSESAPGTGRLCGGFTLDRRFEEFLHKKLHGCRGWGPKAMQRAMIRFETEKRLFTCRNSNPKVIRLPGMRDDPKKGIANGRLKLSWQEMENIFSPAVNSIIELIKGQLADSQALVDAVILTGGLGQNDYIRQRIQEALPSSVKFLCPKNGWAAVSAGALLKGLDGSGYLIQSRMARENMGISTPILFDPTTHDANRAYIHHDKQYVDQMHWFIKKGDSYMESQEISIEKHTTWKRDSQLQSVLILLEIYCCNTALGVDPPQYLSKSMRLQTTLRCNFKANERVIRNLCPLEDDAYKIPYHILITYSPTKIDYRISSPVTREMDVEVEYK